jgi:hypothetical protein
MTLAAGRGALPLQTLQLLDDGFQRFPVFYRGAVGELDAQAVLVLAPDNTPKVGFASAGLQDYPHPRVLPQALRGVHITAAQADVTQLRQHRAAQAGGANLHRGDQGVAGVRALVVYTLSGRLVVGETPT